MEERKNKKNRSNSGSSSVAVGIVAFLLGFLFAFIVLIGSIFGVGYIALTTDINEVFRVFGLENVKENPEGEDDKYNYINADKDYAPTILALIQEIMEMANDGLGEIDLNRVDALAPITDTVLNEAYKYIDKVVAFDKEYFEGVPLTSIIDCVTNSLYYIRTGDVIGLLNGDMGYSIDISNNLILDYIINGVEANYATVKIGGQTVKVNNGESEKDLTLPVFYDYYVSEEIGGDTAYYRRDPVNGEDAIPHNLKDVFTNYVCETKAKLDNKPLYKVYYVPCQVTNSGVAEAEYITDTIPVEDDEVSFTKDGVTIKLKYNFKYLEYGEKTDFIVVKPEYVNGKATFVLDYDSIKAAESTNPEVESSYRFKNYSYKESYARKYYSDKKEDLVRTDKNNDRLYGLPTINGINYFKDNTGKVIDYDPITVADLMLDAFAPLYQVPVSSVVGEDQAETVNGIFGDTSLGDILNQKVVFTDLIQDILLSTFMTNVSVDDSVMAYIVHNVTNVQSDGSGNYTATYTKDGVKKNVKLEVKVNKDKKTVIKSVIDIETGKKLEGNKVSDLSNLTSDMTVGVFLDVKVDDAIMTYLGYGVTDVEEFPGQDYSHVGKYEDKDVQIYTNSSKIITKVVYADTGKEVKGTTVNNITNRIEGLTEVLTLPDVMDIEADSAIMAYIGYGVYDVVAESGAGYSHTGLCDVNGVPVKVYIATKTSNGKPIVTSIWRDGNIKIKGTKVNEVSARLDSITDKIAITEFIDIDPNEAIMAYIGYGISGVAAESGTDSLGNSYTYKGTYKDGLGVNHDCYMTVDGSSKITNSWYIDGGVKQPIAGTKVGAVPDKVSALQDTLTIGEIITIDGNSTMILQAIKDTTIGGLDDRIYELTVSDVLEEEQINNNTVLPLLRDTRIIELGDAIDKLLIQEIYIKDVYEDVIIDEVTDATFNPAYLYYTKVGDKYEIVTINCPSKPTGIVEGSAEYNAWRLQYDNQVGKLTQSDWDNRGDTKYYTYGEAKGMWNIVLSRIDGNKKTEKAYTLNNMGNMVTTCSEAVYNSTLFELKNANVITGIEDAKLNKTLRTVDSGNPYTPGTGVNYLYISVDASGNVIKVADAAQAKKLGELTLKQLIKAVTEML